MATLPARAALLLAAALLAAPAAAAARAEASVQPAPQRCYLLERPGAVELDAADLRDEPVAFGFPRGERLEYAVHYFGIEIGRASIEVARFVRYRGRRLAHVVGSARTNAFFSLLYRVDDRSESWIDADRLVTVRTATHTRHGRHREIYEEIDFDWDAHFVRIFEARRHRGDARRLAFDFGPFVHDPFDLLYALRMAPLAPGRAAAVPVYASQRVYGLSLDVGEPRALSSPALGGPTRAWVVVPRNTLDGEPQDDGRGRIYVSADARRIPLRATGWFRSTQGFRVGGVRADLVDYRPGDAGWPAPRAGAPPQRPAPVPTRDGRPVWTPPPALAAQRAERDVEPVDRRFALTWPDGVGCPETPPPAAPPGPQRAGALP